MPRDRRGNRSGYTHFIAIALVALAVAACGGGGGGGGSSAAPTAQVPAPKNILIEQYGDSTTVGCTYIPDAVGVEPCAVPGYTVASQTAPQVLQSLLQAKYGARVTVANQGVSGTTFGDAVNGTNHMNGVTWESKMAASKADVVTINFGLNDINFVDEPIEDDITAMVASARAHRKTVVIITPNPNIGAHQEPMVAAVRDRILSQAKILSVPVADDFTAVSLDDWVPLISDTEHPTSAGYTVKAKVEFPALSSIIDSLS